MFWLTLWMTLSFGSADARGLGFPVTRPQSRGAVVMVPEQLYNGVNQPVMIETSAPRGNVRIDLVLLSADGETIGKVTNTPLGRFDLAAIMPKIRTLRRASYLQMLSDDAPVGSPLVLEPLRSRMKPVTERATRADGRSYTRIVGWEDQYTPPQLSASAQSDQSSRQTSSDTPSDDDAEAVDETTESARFENQAADQPDQTESKTDSGLEQDGEEVKVGRLNNGLRIYPQRDVVLHTSFGGIVLGMRPDEASNTVWNFLQLAEGGFYDGVIFHRIVPLTPAGDPFVIQTGDPTGSGDGGPGYWLPMERSELEHDFGVVSMARADDPDSAGSQFFFCLSRAGTARLDGQYCAFGWTIAGAETIRAIADVELANVTTGRPVDPPRIISAELRPAPPLRPGEARHEVHTASEQHSQTADPWRVPR